MSTAKTKKVNPKAPYSSTLSPEMKLHYKRCLVKSQDGMWYLFPTAAVGSVSIINPRHVFPDFDTFQQGLNEKTLGDFFSEAHCRDATKEEQKDQFEMAVMAWMQLAKCAIDRLNSAPDPAKINPETGKLKRVFKKLENRGYEIIKLELDANLKMPPQAKTCLEFFSELVKKYNPEGEDKIVTVPEKEVQAYVLEQQIRLKTRQDPWRIFQYYRPTLIQNGFIRLV